MIHINNYIEVRVPRIIQSYEKSLLKSVKRGINQNPCNLFTLAVTCFKNLGQCKYLINNDVNGIKNYYYNAIVAASRTLEIYDEKIGDSPTMGLSMMTYKSLLYGLISENREEVIKFAELMGRRDEMEKGRTSIHVYNLGYALKYLVLDDKANAQIFIDKIKDNSKEKFNTGFYEMFQGIINSDSTLLKEGVEKRLVYHKKKRSFKNTPDEFIAIEILGFIKLGRMKDVYIEIDDPLLPQEIIEESEVDYQLHELLQMEYK